MMRLTRSLAVALLAAVAWAIQDEVDLGYSVYAGAALENGISQWLGIRYAAPPLGNLRFMPPEDPPRTEAVQPATEHPKTCLPINPGPEDSDSHAEDCLFLNVQAPTNATEDSRLPVFVFIQGGGFSQNSNPNINASGIIIAADYDLVVVDLNYRVGPYGFLTDGDNVTANNGLRDQRKALEWVQDHISEFGGDPEHVVIGGVSAGGASVVFHLLADGGNDTNLFVGAIGASPSFAMTLTVPESQYQYNQLATRLECAVAESLACLRNKTSEEIQAQNFNIPFPGGANPPTYQWLPTLDHDFVTDYPYRSLAEGRFVRVPTIWGDDKNGGTVFAPRNASSLAESNQFILDQYATLTPAQFGEINDMYPNPNASACPSLGCYWRHASNVYQEIRFMCPALYCTSVFADDGGGGRRSVCSYHYLWNVEDPEQMEAGLGVPHTVVLQALLGSAYTKDEPESYKPGGINEHASPVVQAYWTSFMRTLDPNMHRLPGTAKWVPRSGAGQQSGRRSRIRRTNEKRDASKDRLVFGTGGTAEMVGLDDGLLQRCDYWVDHGVEMLL